MPQAIINSFLQAVAVTPASFGNMEAWWKADSFALADNTAIGGGGNEWQDQSVNNRDGTQATAGARPLFRTNIFGSMPSVRFDGSDDFLQFTSDIVFAGGAPAGEFTIILVGKSLNGADGEILGHETDNIQIRVNRAGASVVSMFNAAGSPELISTAFSSALTNVKMIVWRRSQIPGADSGAFRENKTARGTSPGMTSQYTLQRIGKTSFGGFPNWDIGELVLYSQGLTDANLDSLYDGYFKPRWGLP